MPSVLPLLLLLRAHLPCNHAAAAAAVSLVVTCHMMANIANTLFDYKTGFDTVQHADDRLIVTQDPAFSVVLSLTLHLQVDGIMSARSTAIVTAAVAALTVAAAIIIACITTSVSFVPYILLATFISFAYSAPPLHLKARAMGDLPVFIAFGPLPAAFVWHVTTGTPPPPLLLAFAVPFGLWASAVLHCNNMRDAAHDARIGATLPILLGAHSSRALFRSCLALAVLSGSFVMLYSPSITPAASVAAASAAGVLAVVGARLTSNVLSRQPLAQPQDVAAAAGVWGVCYLTMILAAEVTCLLPHAHQGK